LQKRCLVNFHFHGNYLINKFTKNQCFQANSLSHKQLKWNEWETTPFLLNDVICSVANANVMNSSSDQLGPFSTSHQLVMKNAITRSFLRFYTIARETMSSVTQWYNSFNPLCIPSSSSCTPCSQKTIQKPLNWHS
jgi:hypothetical protein